MDKDFKENNEGNVVKDIGMARIIVDWLIVVYLAIDLCFILWAFAHMYAGLSALGIIVAILSIIILLFGCLSLLPIKPITLLYKNKFGSHWKMWRACIVIGSLCISNLLFIYIQTYCSSIIVDDIDDNTETYEIDADSNISYYDENEHSISDESSIQDEANDSIGNLGESEESSDENNLNTSIPDTSYTGTDAIIKAKEYFAENEGEYDDLHIEFHDIDILKDDKSDDYYITGNGFWPVYSSQCVRVEEESDGIMTYYFLDNTYSETYIKIVHDNTWDTIFYGNSIDQCNDICGQF